MMRHPGMNPAAARWKRPGSSLRRDRSPVAPNRTTICGSFGPTPAGILVMAWFLPVRLGGRLSAADRDSHATRQGTPARAARSSAAKLPPSLLGNRGENSGFWISGFDLPFSLPKEAASFQRDAAQSARWPEQRKKWLEQRIQSAKGRQSRKPRETLPPPQSEVRQPSGSIRSARKNPALRGEHASSVSRPMTCVARADVQR